MRVISEIGVFITTESDCKHTQVVVQKISINIQQGGLNVFIFTHAFKTFYYVMNSVKH